MNDTRSANYKRNVAGLTQYLAHLLVATLGGYGGKQAMLKHVLVQLDARLRTALEEARVEMWRCA